MAKLRRQVGLGLVLVVVMVLVVQLIPGRTGWSHSGPRVLVFDDGASMQQALPVLEAAGFWVVVAGHINSFSGLNPDLGAFQAVIVFNGYQGYGPGMLEAGQEALANYVRAGGGLLLTEWTAQETANGGNQILQQEGLMLVESSGGRLGGDTYRVVAAHPITASMPAYFRQGFHGHGVLRARSGTVLVTGDHCGDALTIGHVGKGRVAHLAMAGSFARQTGAWNAEFSALFAATVDWLAHGKADPDDAGPPLAFVPQVSPAGWSPDPMRLLTFGTEDPNTGIDRYELSIDGSDFAEVTSPWLLGPLADGVYQLVVRAYNRVGNYTDAQAFVLVDSCPPWMELEVAGPSFGPYVSSATGLQVVGGDGLSGIASMTVEVDGEAVLGGTIYLQGPDGPRQLVARAVDQAGNGTTLKLDLVLDNSPPTTTADLCPAWQPGPVVVRLMAEDVGSGVADTYYRAVEATAWIPGTALEIREDGVHHITFYSTDRLGNAEVPQIAPVRLDATPPQARLEGVKEVYGPGEAIAFWVHASDLTSDVKHVLMTLNGETLLESNAPVDRKVQVEGHLAGPGLHRLDLRVEDHAGNTASVTAGFEVMDRPYTLEALVASLEAQRLLGRGPATSLAVLARNAADRERRGQYQAASQLLAAFITQVSNQRGKQIDPLAAELLLEAAASAREMLAGKDRLP
ncbi:MAG: hypothetical protein AB1445_11990 [Bacillota bacterium]